INSQIPAAQAPYHRAHPTRPSRPSPGASDGPSTSPDPRWPATPPAPVANLPASLPQASSPRVPLPRALAQEPAPLPPPAPAHVPPQQAPLGASAETSAHPPENPPMPETASAA